METGDPNHLEIAPATAFPVYQIEEHRLPVLQNEVFYHNGTTHYAGAGHAHSSIPYGPLPVFTHPRGYIASTYQVYPYGATLNATNVMRYRPQFNFIQQPLLHRNFSSFRDSLPMAYHSQVSGDSNFVPSSPANPEQFDGSFLSSGSIESARYQSSLHNRGISSNNDRDVHTQLKLSYGSPDYVNFSSVDHNIVGGLVSSGQNLISGFFPGHHMGGWHRMNTNGRLMHGTHPGDGSSSLNFFPMPQGHLQHYFPMPNDRNLSLHGDRDARYVIRDPHSCFHGSIAASRPFSCSQGGLSYKNKAKLSSMDSENATITRITNESQHGTKNTDRTSPTESSTVSPTTRAAESTIGNIRSGRAQWSQLSRFNNDPAQPMERNGIQTTLAPHQVWQKKTKTQPSIRLSKPSSKQTVPIYHIRWNGSDESCQAVGENCQLCNKDLTNAPTVYDYERDNEPGPFNLTNVAVLPCGHAFHSECLQLITPEDQSREPPCEICASGKF